MGDKDSLKSVQCFKNFHGSCTTKDCPCICHPPYRESAGSFDSATPVDQMKAIGEMLESYFAVSEWLSRRRQVIPYLHNDSLKPSKRVLAARRIAPVSKGKAANMVILDIMASVQDNNIRLTLEGVLTDEGDNSNSEDCGVAINKDVGV